jgi:hypothetical protein
MCAKVCFKKILRSVYVVHLCVFMVLGIINSDESTAEPTVSAVEMECVYCVVRTESFNIICATISPYKFIDNFIVMHDK